MCSFMIGELYFLSERFFTSLFITYIWKHSSVDELVCITFVLCTKWFQAIAAGKAPVLNGSHGITKVVSHCILNGYNVWLKKDCNRQTSECAVRKFYYYLKISVL